jgi:hypothetical protein
MEESRLQGSRKDRAMRRFAPLATALCLAAAVPARAEPTVYHSTRLLEGVSGEECLTRARSALQAQGFRLAEGSPGAQYGVNGEFTGLVVCVQTATPVLVVVIAGGDSTNAERHRNAIRDAIMSGRAARPGVK